MRPDTIPDIGYPARERAGPIHPGAPGPTHMKRNLAPALLALWGVALACLAVLDAADYEALWASFGWR